MDKISEKFIIEYEKYELRKASALLYKAGFIEKEMHLDNLRCIDKDEYLSRRGVVNGNNS